MGKRKTVYYLDQIWKRRFDYEHEILIYKYLCKGMKKKELKKLIPEERFASFEDWDNHIRNAFGDTPTYYKKEFCRYAENRIRKLDNNKSYMNVFMLPLLLSIVGPVILTYLTDAGVSLSELIVSISELIQKSSWLILFLIFVIMMIFLVGVLFALPILYLIGMIFVPVFHHMRDSGLEKNFWEDCMRVVLEMI